MSVLGTSDRPSRIPSPHANSTCIFQKDAFSVAIWSLVAFVGLGTALHGDGGVVATAILKKVKSAAPGQYLGYGLQDVRLCRHLLRAPNGCAVSLEFIEDTAIHKPDGTLWLEQSKSSLTGNPLGDSAVEFWKSFANWSTLCAENKIDPESTQFRLFICPQKDGSLAESLHGASSEDEIKAILATIAKKVTPSTKLKGCNPKITEFLSAGETACIHIIRNFRLLKADDPLEPIREVLRFSVLEESLDDFCAHAIGMAKNRMAALIRSKEKQVIDAEAFRRDVRDFIRRHGALGLLLPTTERPSSSEIDKMLSSAPVFVQQLVKVAMPTEHIVRAVSDYLRSDADRTLWAAEGRIVAESLDELHDTLEGHFQITRDEIEELHAGHEAEIRGRQLYRRCVTHQAALEGRSVPGYFVPGTFNMLADHARVGWHPQYLDFFAGV